MHAMRKVSGSRVNERASWSAGPRWSACCSSASLFVHTLVASESLSSCVDTLSAASERRGRRGYGLADGVCILERHAASEWLPVHARLDHHTSHPSVDEEKGQPRGARSLLTNPRSPSSSRRISSTSRAPLFLSHCSNTRWQSEQHDLSPSESTALTTLAHPSTRSPAPPAAALDDHLARGIRALALRKYSDACDFLAQALESSSVPSHPLPPLSCPN